MKLLNQIRELKKSKATCRVEYGKTLSVVGVVTEFTPSRVWVDSDRGEYGIPISDVRSIKSVDA